MSEEWRDVIGCEGRYQVSNLGRVRSMIGVKKPFGAIIGGSLAADGYPVVRLQMHGRGVVRKVHHLVLESFVGARPIGAYALHNDNDRTNARLDNLRWGSPKENQVDRLQHGTSNRGRANPAAKIDEDVARKVKQRLADLGDYHGVNRAVAKELGISARIVSEIKLGKCWGHVAP